MDWLKNVQTGLLVAQKQAQEAAERLMHSETALKARELAQQATVRAKVFAEHATDRARVSTLLCSFPESGIMGVP